MPESLTVALAGDVSINRRISVYTHERFLDLIKILRDADVTYTHLETIIHDYDGPEVYPAAEAGWVWQRSPRFIVDELKWAGFNIVSHASNHCLDYSYGGLLSTLNALDEAGIVHAGTGRNLAEAREPAYLDTGKGRVALISMCSSFAKWARAGEARRDVKGRPGLNPLRFNYVVDAETMENIKQLGIKLGWWIRQDGDTYMFNPAGQHNSVTKFVVGKEPGVTAAADADDAEGNLKSIKAAKRQADWVMVHLHSHEWDWDKGLSVPAKFIPPFARACIDAGADLFIAEGSHSPLRGIEMYKNKPIFYDPGDFMSMGTTITRFPADFYFKPGYGPEARRWDATVADGFDAREAMPPPLNPSGGYRSTRVVAAVIPVCSIEEGGKLTEVKLHPVSLVKYGIGSSRRPPRLAEGEEARKIIEYLGELSAPFGTKIDFQDGVGTVRL